jgi:hypothetical protein
VIVIGIDPGATIGVAAYDTAAGRVLYSAQYRDPLQVTHYVGAVRQTHVVGAIGIERARIYGAGGASVANTIEQVGWLLASLGASLPTAKMQSATAAVTCIRSNAAPWSAPCLPP